MAGSDTFFSTKSITQNKKQNKPKHRRFWWNKFFQAYNLVLLGISAKKIVFCFGHSQLRLHFCGSWAKKLIFRGLPIFFQNCWIPIKVLFILIESSNIFHWNETSKKNQSGWSFWQNLMQNLFFFNWDSFHARLNSHYTRHGVTRKEAQKRLQDTENLFRKNLQLKDVC